MSAGMGAPMPAVDSSVSETLRERRTARAGGPARNPADRVGQEHAHGGADIPRRGGYTICNLWEARRTWKNSKF